MKLTRKKLQALTEELELVEVLYKEALEAQRKAVELGDLSENEENRAAKADVQRYDKRINEIKSILNDYEIVSVDTSPRITLGSTVIIERCDEKGNVLEEPLKVVFDTEGDIDIEGVLGVTSPLGKAILNGPSGIYKVANEGGIYYKVTKVLEE